MMPVHAIVKTLALSIVPQVTITGGTGKSIVPDFQVVFVIDYPLLLDVAERINIVLSFLSGSQIKRGQESCRNIN